jgi:outer membrane lipoprotein-sorting protein
MFNRLRWKTAAAVALAWAALAVPGALGAAQAPANPVLAPAGEQEPERPAALSPAVREVLQKVEEAGRKVENISAQVVYDQEISLLDEHKTCTGRLLFAKPGRIALKLGRPRNEDVYCNGRTWWVVSHDDKNVEIYRAADEKQGAPEAAFLTFGYGGDTDELVRRYRIEIAEKTEQEELTAYRLKFTPRTEPGQPGAQYSALEVVVHSDTWLPRRIVLHESSGEIVHTYRLRRVKVNVEMDEDVFEYEPPRGYTILRPREL